MLTESHREAVKIAAILEQRTAGIRDGDEQAIADARRGLRRMASICAPEVLAILHTTIIDLTLSEHGEPTDTFQ